MVAVDTGAETTCAVTNTGALKCAGRFAASLDSGVASVSIGQAHSCVVTTLGGVKCWGFNSKGQLGNGAVLVGINNTPVDVVGLGSGSGVVSVATEGVHTCVVLATGAVKPRTGG